MNEEKWNSQHTHAFVVKLWLEDHDAESGRPIWRGYITHAYNHERRALKSTQELVTFLEKYINQWKLDE